MAKVKGKRAITRAAATSSNSRNVKKSNNALTKKATNSRKWSASRSDSDVSSGEESEERHPRKKTKHVGWEADEEVEVEQLDDEEPEEIDEDEEMPGEDVSCWAGACRAVKWDLRESKDLEERHQGDIPEELAVKSDTTKDLLTIFLDRVSVNLKKGNTVKLVKGRWCLPCR
jgi:hypothetical protein